MKKATTLIALAAVLAAIFYPAPDDDVGAAQLRDAQAHAQRDADERRVQAALRGGRRQ
jgi:urease accessory protein UreF